MKKILSLLLSLCMVLAAFDITCFADSNEESYDRYYINQHMEYVSSGQYEKDITGTFDGNMKSLIEDIKDNIKVKSYDLLKAYDTLFNFDFSDITEEEQYELLLAQIFFNSEGAATIEDTFGDNLTDAIISCVEEIVELKEFASANKDLVEKIATALGDVKRYNNSSDATNVKKKLKEIFDIFDSGSCSTSIKKKICEKTFQDLGGELFLSEATLATETCSQVLMYIASCRAYAETRQMFTDVLLMMRKSLAVESDNELFSPNLNSDELITEKTIQNLLGMSELEYNDPLLGSINLNTLAEALERYYSVLTTDSEDAFTMEIQYAFEKIKDGSVDNLYKTMKSCALTLLSDFPVIQEYKALANLIHQGVVDLEAFTNFDDQSYNATMVQRLYCMLYIEKKVCDYASLITSPGKSLLKMLGMTADEYELERAQSFDEAVSVYKSILLTASLYGKKYAEAAQGDALTKKSRNWYAELVSMMTSESLNIENIKCHDDASTSNSQLYADKLNSLIQQYGSFSTYQSGVMNSQEDLWMNKNGVMSSVVLDFDNDQQDEMLVVVSTEQDGVSLQMYEADDGEAVLYAEKPFAVNDKHRTMIKDYDEGRMQALVIPSDNGYKIVCQYWQRGGYYSEEEDFDYECWIWEYKDGTFSDDFTAYEYGTMGDVGLYVIRYENGIEQSRQLYNVDSYYLRDGTYGGEVPLYDKMADGVNAYLTEQGVPVQDQEKGVTSRSLSSTDEGCVYLFYFLNRFVYYDSQGDFFEATLEVGDQSGQENDNAEKTDLSQYMGTDINTFVNMIGDMENEGATSGVGYNNDHLVVEDAQYDQKIDYIDIRGECEYSIYGITYNTSKRDAALIAENMGAVFNGGESTDTYRYYQVSENQSLVFLLDDNGNVERVMLMQQ